MVNPVLRDLIGIRFIEGGRDTESGLDCWGLAMEVYRRYGINIPDFTVDAFAFQTIDRLANESIMTKSWEEVYHPEDKDAPLIVLMRMHPKFVNHAGVFIGNNRIIHTMRRMNVVLTRVDAIKTRITGYYRYVDNH